MKLRRLFLSVAVVALMAACGGKATETATETAVEETVATVQPIKFEEFTDGSLSVEKENIELLMDLQLQVSVELPFEAGNIYQDLNAELLVIVEAIQGNASVKDEKEVVLVNFWDGSSDEEGLLDNTDDVNKEVIIETAEELSAFRDNVNNGITYKGYTVKLISDIDLNGVEEDLFSINKEGIIRYDYNKEFDERIMKQINIKKGK